MVRLTLYIACGLMIPLIFGSDARTAEQPTELPNWDIGAAPGEDLLVVRRNEVLGKFAKARNNRVTIVKFEDGTNIRCPTITSLLFSSGPTLEMFTPNFSLYEGDGVAIYPEGDLGANRRSVVVQNSQCRYVLDVKRFARDSEGKLVEVQLKRGAPPPQQIEPPAEKSAEHHDVPGLKRQGDRLHLNLREMDRQLVGFTETITNFELPAHNIDFTGAAYFGPTSFGIYLANAPRDLTLTSESNHLTHTYEINIGNAEAAVRIAIGKEIHSNGSWIGAWRALE